MIFEVGWLILMCAGCSATIILCLVKWRIFEWLQIHYNWTVCKFCLGFWLCATMALALYIFYSSNIFYIAIPFAGASITWKLIK